MLHFKVECRYQKLQPPVKVLKLIKQELENIVKKRQQIAPKELTSLQRKLSKIEEKELKLADELISQSISREVHSKIQQKITEQKRATQERFAQLKVDYREPLDFLDKCIVVSSNLYHLHKKFKFQQRKNLLRAIFERIEVKDRAIVSVKLNPPVFLSAQGRFSWYVQRSSYQPDVSGRF